MIWHSYKNVFPTIARATNNKIRKCIPQRFAVAKFFWNISDMRTGILKKGVNYFENLKKAKRCMNILETSFFSVYKYILTHLYATMDSCKTFQRNA